MCQSPKSYKTETPLKRYLNGDGFCKQSRQYLRHTCVRYNLELNKCTYSQLIHAKNKNFNMLTHIFSSKLEIDSVQGIYIEQNCTSKVLYLHSQCGYGVKFWIFIAHFLLSYLLKADENTSIMTGRKTRSGQSNVTNRPNPMPVMPVRTNQLSSNASSISDEIFRHLQRIGEVQKLMTLKWHVSTKTSLKTHRHLMVKFRLILCLVVQHILQE